LRSQPRGKSSASAVFANRGAGSGDGGDTVGAVTVRSVSVFDVGRAGDGAFTGLAGRTGRGAAGGGLTTGSGFVMARSTSAASWALVRGMRTSPMSAGHSLGSRRPEAQTSPAGPRISVAFNVRKGPFP